MLSRQVELSLCSIIKPLAITGTIIAFSKEKLYREPGVGSLKDVKC